MVSKPHGGKLVRKVMPAKARERLLGGASELPRVEVSETVAIDAENIGHGVYSPLEGFMGNEELESVLYTMRLPSDVPWTMPILLDVPEESAAEFGEGDEVLIAHGGAPIAVVHVEEVYRYDKGELAGRVFETKDPAHPGVAKALSMGDLLVGGEIELISELPNPFERYTLKPIETRVLFRERGWRAIVGFQTRNVPHLGHEYLQKSALVFADGLFINPVVGRKKRGDFKDEVILAAYDALIKNYYPRDSVVLSVVRYEMRYAGPREAVHHAIMRKNFGCTHFVVGRDHAGVGKYYGPYEAQEIFRKFPDLGITPIFFRDFFFCKKCGGVANERVCPHGEEHRLRFSGTKVREMLRRGERVPPEILRPEVAEVIARFENPFVE